MPQVDEAIARYIRTGDHDDYFTAWGDGSVLERIRRGTADLKCALVAEVTRRAPEAITPAAAKDLDCAALARARLDPMIAGFFAPQERAPVLQMFERSVVFVTPENIARILSEVPWLSTAWELAELYLGSVGAAPLGDANRRIVGFSESTTCYVSMEYFSPRSRFADFVVHEAAHVFHNVKRGTIGLPETPRQERLLEIEYRMRETFAYTCEAYAQLAMLGADRRERLSLLDELAREPMPSDERVDPDEYLGILREAVSARNGWKRILARCARKPRS